MSFRIRKIKKDDDANLILHPLTLGTRHRGNKRNKRKTFSLTFLLFFCRSVRSNRYIQKSHPTKVGWDFCLGVCIIALFWYYPKRAYAGIAQLVEHSTDTRKVLGSTPSARTHRFYDSIFVSQHFLLKAVFPKSIGCPRVAQNFPKLSFLGSAYRLPHAAPKAPSGHNA